MLYMCNVNVYVTFRYDEVRDNGKERFLAPSYPFIAPYLPSKEGIRLVPRSAEFPTLALT